MLRDEGTGDRKGGGGEMREGGGDSGEVQKQRSNNIKTKTKRDGWLTTCIYTLCQLLKLCC